MNWTWRIEVQEPAAERWLAWMQRVSPNADMAPETYYAAHESKIPRRSILGTCGNEEIVDVQRHVNDFALDGAEGFFHAWQGDDADTGRAVLGVAAELDDGPGAVFANLLGAMFLVPFLVTPEGAVKIDQNTIDIAVNVMRERFALVRRWRSNQR